MSLDRIKALRSVPPEEYCAPTETIRLREPRRGPGEMRPREKGSLEKRSQQGTGITESFAARAALVMPVLHTECWGWASGSFPTVNGTAWKEVTKRYQLSLRLNKNNVELLRRGLLGDKNGKRKVTGSLCS